MLKILGLAAVTSAFAVNVAGLATAEGQGNATPHEIVPGVYSFDSGGGYHSMFVVTGDWVAAFETVNSQPTTAMLEAIKKRHGPARQMCALHWDHSSGGGVMQAAGIETAMHSKAVEWLVANPGRDTSNVDIAWDGAKRDTPLADIPIQTHYLVPNLGLGMTVFVIPELRVTYIGDLVAPSRVMLSIVPDFNIGEWERSLEGIDFAVCSHNDLPADEVENGCTKAHVTEEREFIGGLRDAIFPEFESSAAPVAIPGAFRLPQYSRWIHYDDWLELNAQRMFLDLWMRPPPWAPAG